MMDLRGTQLQEDERDMLRHPLTGGLIFFSRNFESAQQIEELAKEIHALQKRRLLICVDHEGGRVQRFREGFTVLPPMRRFGEIYGENRKRAKRLAEMAGWLMATELNAVGIDFSFAPVLDLDFGVSEVIGDRSFHRDPDVVSDLAHSLIIGMKKGGMAATGKHFPGHGAVAADSHVALPVDERSLADIRMDDLVPFERLVEYGLAGIMPAHVRYPRVDEAPAGFSRVWLQQILRKELNFQGVIFSDDLTMEGATVAGDIVARAEVAIDAGCDMALVCNNSNEVARLLDGYRREPEPTSMLRLARMHGKPVLARTALAGDPRWQESTEAISRLV
ncbi:MAG: beta-N-acetylhexosaminidase [Gammaproteobacteria bacterium]|nr:beta-N-acetylhexosaminidase [Gammaproteobacteria bacterium]